jgi:SAM-dependent methyltransferase
MNQATYNYNPQRFKNAARFYTQGRPTYPKQLSQRIAARVGLTQQHAVLDLGTGPGFLAIDFAPLAGQVTAIDPAPEMLEQAQKNFEEAHVQVRLLQGSSASLDPAQLGSFQLVTIGRAFHWMERVATLQALDRLISQAGAVALFSESYPDIPANAWHDDFQPLIDSYGEGDPARIQRSPLRHEAVLLDSTFDHLERISVLERRVTPVERFVDRALSFATTWHGRPGSREHDLPQEVREVLAPHADDQGYIHEVIEGQALIAWRTADLDL